MVFVCFTKKKHGIASSLLSKSEAALKEEGINKIFCLVFKDNDPENSFWEEHGYAVRINLNYRNKSLCDSIPQGE